MIPLSDIKALLGKISGPKWTFGVRLSGSENHKGFYIRGGRWIVADVMPLDEEGVEGGANAEFIAKSPEIIAELIKSFEVMREVSIQHCHGQDNCAEIIDRKFESRMKELEKK